jgi:hypothetical protein
VSAAQAVDTGAVLAPLRLAFDALESAGASWAVLRGGLTAADHGRDVDVLVGPGELDLVDPAVRGAGWIPIPGWTHGTHRSWLGFDPDGPRWPILDVSDELAFGRAPVRLDGAACLRRSIDGKVRRLAPGDAWWSACFHAFLDTRAESAAALDGLRDALADGTVPGRPPFPTDDATRGDAWDPERVVAAARAARWDDAARAVRALDAAGGLWPAGVRFARGLPDRLARRLTGSVRRPARLTVLVDDPARVGSIAGAALTAIPHGLRPVIRTARRDEARVGLPADATIRPDEGGSDDDLRAAIAAGIWQAIGGRSR